MESWISELFMEGYLNMNPWKTNECPLKRDDLNRKRTFQPLIFKGHVSFPGSFTSHSQLLFHDEKMGSPHHL